MTEIKFKFFYEHNRTPNGKKPVTGVQVITASQAQSIRCRWQALFVLPITEAHTSRQAGTQATSAADTRFKLPAVRLSDI